MANVERIGKATARRGRVQGDQREYPVTMLALGALAVAITTRSLRRWSGVGRSARPAGDQRALEETSSKLRLVTEQLEETRTGLAEAQAEVLRMSEAVKTASDRAETEM